MTKQLEWVDTHAHVYYGDVQHTNWVEECQEKRIKYILVPAIDTASHDDLFSLQTEHPHLCFPMIGLHPCSVKHNYVSELRAVQNILSTKQVVAVGEIGLDFFHDTTFKKEQIIAFQCQLEYACDYNLPVSVHTRNATKEALEIISNISRKVRGVLHCFSGNKELAQAAVEYGLFLGIGGTITYRSNAELRKIIEDIGIEHIVLETDSPFLSPHPYRGKTNTPCRIPVIGSLLAEILAMPIEEVAQKTTDNACTLFQLKRKNRQSI